jgi:hypothetical protein
MSSAAAATNSRPPAPICPQRRRPMPLPPKPLPNQIPIDREPLTSPRGFFLPRLSDAGLIPDRPLVLGPASETLQNSRHPHQISAPVKWLFLHRPTAAGSSRNAFSHRSGRRGCARWPGSGAAEVVLKRPGMPVTKNATVRRSRPSSWRGPPERQRPSPRCSQR